MKVLVTGAGGYIGKHVISALLKKDVQIIACDLSCSYQDKKICSINKNIQKEANSSSLYQDIQKPDVVIHLAWQDGFNHGSEFHLSNLYSHYCFLKNMIDSGCHNINVMGTMHEVGYYEGAINEDTPCTPLSFYGLAKNTLRQAISLYCKKNSNEVSLKWLRAFYITGDDERNNSIFTKIIEWEKEGKESFPFTDGKNKYDFISVDKLGELIAKASLQKQVDGVINICSGNPISLRDKVEEFITDHNFKIRPQYGAFPSRPYDSPAIWGNTQKLQKILEE